VEKLRHKHSRTSCLSAQCVLTNLAVEMADVTGIVKGFLLNAPPGEFLEVVSGTWRSWAVLETDARPDSGVVLGLALTSGKFDDRLKYVE